MNKNIEKRAKEEAKYILYTNGTVRSIAPIFGVSKSTVHNDLTKNLEKIDKNLFEKVQKILEKNLSERHLRGGEATKKKYKENNKKITKNAYFLKNNNKN